MRLTVAALFLLSSTAEGQSGRGRAAAGPPAPPPRWTAFTQAMDSLARADSVVGWAAVYVEDGRATAWHVRGLADREPRRTLDERALFHYGSITKTLTAVAIMQLRDRGRLTLDDPVTRHVPELRQVVNPHGSMDDVTIRMLLSHTSGLQNPTWPWRRYASWEPFEPARWEQLVAMMPYQRLLFRPGARYGYSNPAFIYLARIVEQLSGDPWQSYIYKNLWLPLGMTQSYFAATPWHLAPDRSNNFTLVRDSGGQRVMANGHDFDPGITIPNGGWNGPLADLVMWAGFLTRAERGDTVRGRLFETLLRRSTLEEMWQPVVRVDNRGVGAAAGEAMGLSFFLRTARGARIVGHTGEQAGFRSFLYLNPETRAAIIGVFNTTNDADGAASGARWDRVIAAGVETLVP